MKALTFKQGCILLAAILLSSSFTTCTNPAETETAAQPSTGQMIARGKYLVTIGSCHDCHSPKIFKSDGSMIHDEERQLSGHPAGTQLPGFDTAMVKPGMWCLGSPDLTAWVGPWGISYAANLTPDSLTGIGEWTEENFIGALRKGKHLGHDGGRPILPPMPWFYIRKMTDDDLRSVFAYLKSLKPISNKVPTPVPPADMASMAGGAPAATASVN